VTKIWREVNGDGEVHQKTAKRGQMWGGKYLKIAEKWRKKSTEREGGGV